MSQMEPRDCTSATNSQNIRRKEKHLIVVLIQHDDNLSHVVELGDSTEVIHGTLPLLVVLLLLHMYTDTQNKSASALCLL